MRVLIFTLFGLISSNLYAHNCGGEFQPATGTCRIIGSDGQQILYNSDPPQSGNQSVTSSSRSITVQVPSKFGALAYSPSVGHIAGSLNHNSKAEAQQAAIQRCQQGSKNTPCKAIAWVRNGCVAAAAGKVKNKFVVVDGAGHPGTAEQIALQNCKKGGLKDCKIIMPEGCSLP